MAIPNAAPSLGSVPVPISSINTKVLLEDLLTMSTKDFIWPENVDNDCSILCESPISTSILLNTDMLLPLPTGGSIPL